MNTAQQVIDRRLGLTDTQYGINADGTKIAGYSKLWKRWLIVAEQDQKKNKWKLFTDAEVMQMPPTEDTFTPYPTPK